MRNTPLASLKEAQRPGTALAASSELSVDKISIPSWKRVLDVFLILLALPIVAPVALVIALVIKCVSRGSVLFRQERIGFLGEPFTCLKFRTMRVNAVTEVHQGYFTHLMTSDQPMTKMDMMGDSRLIRFGSILRSSGLDELPQLINVLRGEMSIVGPRPCLPYEYASYLPWQKQRFNSVPGLTGLWQVSGKNKTTFDEMIKMDILYAAKKSLWLDVRIILKTFPTIMLQVLEMLAARKRAGKGESLPHPSTQH